MTNHPLVLEALAADTRRRLESESRAWHAGRLHRAAARDRRNRSN
jgi:hypothetical protein